MTNHETPGPDASGEPCGPEPLFPEIRTVLKRPDLSDAALRDVLAEDRLTLCAGLDLNGFLSGAGTADTRARVIRSMVVPPPQHGLKMPAHDLSPPLSVRFGPAVAWCRNVLEALISPGKRRTAPVAAHIRNR